MKQWRRPTYFRSSRARCLVVPALVGLLLVTGCSKEFGPQPRQQQSASLSDVREKIDLIKHDSCFTGNPREKYRSCGGRYLTELNNAVQAARSGGEHTPAAGRIRPLVATITTSINDFQGSACDTAGDPGRCAVSLHTINANLDQLGKELEVASPG